MGLLNHELKTQEQVSDIVTGNVKNSNNLQGRPLAGGLAQGRAFVYRDVLQREHDLFEIDESEVEEEFARIEEALQIVSDDLKSTERRVDKDLDSENAAIFAAQRAMLADPELSLQSILITNSVIGKKKTAVYVSLVTVFSTLAGLIFGIVVK